ncbi:hypothetical protein Tco_0566919 [Tanacetum coccineum]
MYYPRFTKIVVNYVMEKDPSIPRRNKVNWHYARDDPLFTTINVISRNEATQLYGAILPVTLTNEDIRNSESYKEYYAMASGTIPPKTKGSKKKANTDAIPKPKSSTAPKKKKSGTGKQKTSELENISEADLTEAEQLKIVIKRSRLETLLALTAKDDISWKSSDDAQDDEQAQDDDDTKRHEVHETTQEEEDDDENDDDENDQEDDDASDDDEQDQEDDDASDDDKKAKDDDDEEMTKSDNDGDDFVHPKHTTHEDEIIHEKDTDEDDSSISSSDEDDSDNDIEGAKVTSAKSGENMYRKANDQEAITDQLESEVLVRSSKEANTSHAVAANLSELELKRILIDKMEANNSINRSDIQKQLYKALVEAYEADQILLDTYGDTVTIKRPRDGADDDEEPSAGTDRGSKRRRSGKEPASTSAPSETTTKTAGQTTSAGTTTHTKSASQSAPVGDAMHSTDVFKGPADQEFETGVQDEQAEEEVQHLPDWFQKPTRQPSPDHAWNTSVPAVHESVQPWISNLAQQDPRESFDELTDSTFDFSAFVLNRLNVQTLTPELLAGPTFELMKGTCKSLTELEYFCEEVYKATTEKLDWINPEGRKYPHYQTIVKYDRSALWGISHWGKKRRQFYAFATSRESARDVYSKRRIIAVTQVEIVEWHDYKHLDWIYAFATQGISSGLRRMMMLSPFKEGTFPTKDQDIEDMLLLLVQGKVTNLSVEERIAFNVSLRMFTRRVVIQHRVEDLQLGVESYQKKLNLTKPDTYRSNLRRRRRVYSIL